MAFWMVRWNGGDHLSPDREHLWQRAFMRGGTFDCFGTAEGVGGQTLASVSPGDRFIAYQTDTGEIVGVGKVLEVNSDAYPAYCHVQRLHHLLRPPTMSQLIVKDPYLGTLKAFRIGKTHSFRSLLRKEFLRLLRASGMTDTQLTSILKDDEEQKRERRDATS